MSQGDRLRWGYCCDLCQYVRCVPVSVSVGVGGCGGGVFHCDCNDLFTEIAWADDSSESEIDYFAR